MPTSYDTLLESYPEEVEAALAKSEEARNTLSMAAPGLEFIVRDLSRWPTGGSITVAFLGGTTDLHAAIADAAQMISDSCGIELDFGLDPESGRFREWSPNDTTYSADIRVGFDMDGYWSLVGTDSIDRDLTDATMAVGGAPHQRSLNLGGYDQRLPTGWRRTVLHEFLHALAFAHEHQNPLGECQSDFRWADDDGYQRTTDATGRFVADAEGRRPGIYTYLSGPPNNWDRAKIDHNLRADDSGQDTVGQFDAESVMLYRFDPLFYHRNPSPCAPTSEGDTLSEGDIRGLRLLYPDVGDDSKRRSEQAVEVRAHLARMASLESNGVTQRSTAGLANVLDRLCMQTAEA